MNARKPPSLPAGRAVPETKAPVVRLEAISKAFGAVQANKAISLDIHAGRIKALLGENGAGKSTLMSILAGRLQPDSGRILVDGAPTFIDSTLTAHRLGIGMVYQHFMLIEAMTVAENVVLGQAGQGFWLRHRRIARQVADLAAQYGLRVDPDARVADLSMGERQRVEILKLLLRRSRVLIFDEPTAVLTPQETEQLFQVLKQMAARDKAIVFISHKLDEVMAVADEIAILRKGQVGAERKIDQIASKADLAREMVGREVVLRVAREPAPVRQMVLRIEGLNGPGLQDIHLEVRQGEILALVGVAGNGQKPLVETICGFRTPGQGEVRILGRSWKDFFRAHTWDDNLAYVPEDRRGLAVCPNLTLLENFLLTTSRGFTRGPWLRYAHALKRARELITTFDVQPANVLALARRLSGGNLQKLVLAREFFRRPRLIVAEQPTQGLDIGATEEIWKVLLQARRRAGILLVTGDLQEALALSDRIAVLFNGRIMDIFDSGDQARIDRIGLLMAGMGAGQASNAGEAG
jgi:simple sugar transport system ATP-binding protein